MEVMLVRLMLVVVDLVLSGEGLGATEDRRSRYQSLRGFRN